MNFENEIWKDIPNYEGLYQVSNLGRVKSLDRKVLRKDGRINNIKGKMLKFYNTRGYSYVDICKNSKYKKCKIHRLVAKAFIANPNNYPSVNHIDENKKNNSVSNLEWCTVAYNNNYGTCKQRTRESHIKTHGRMVNMFDLNGNFIRCFECSKDVERAGFDRRAVDRCCKLLCKQHRGYTFKYLN